MFKLANVFYYYIHIMPIYEIYLSNQQKTRLSNFLSFRFVWDTPFCQKTAVLRNYYVFINIYVVGQGDQQNDKVGQEIFSPPPPHLVKKVHAPPHLFGPSGSPDCELSFYLISLCFFVSF